MESLQDLEKSSQTLVLCLRLNQKMLETLTDEYWIGEMQDELNQFKQHEVWELVPRPEGTNIIGT